MENDAHLARITRMLKCAGGNTLPSQDNRVVRSRISSDTTVLRYPSACKAKQETDNQDVISAQK